ncbi:MAG: stress response translation initiation inhibitor YciH [Candidatus Brockarchaeota archaeon]|nr:stress response translation initiation inhibitor YciH [Candidatus Brockarchaeota archaeon]MBO3808910.1 stress response translation initiation inhibitor YciH [Candidatus Brockarchaeota archaeon]
MVGIEETLGERIKPFDDKEIFEELSKEEQIITIRLEVTRWNKQMTIIEGIDPKEVDLASLAKKLKAYCACGGTVKNDAIMLQGDHRQKVYNYLSKNGFSERNITIL